MLNLPLPLISLCLKYAGRLRDRSEVLSSPIRDANVNIEKLLSFRVGFSFAFGFTKIGSTNFFL